MKLCRMTKIRGVQPLNSAWVFIICQEVCFAFATARKVEMYSVFSESEDESSILNLRDCLTGL